MHEIGMFQEALDQALMCVPHERGRSIAGVTVRIGDESGIDPDVIAFAFNVLVRDTIAAGAELTIERIAAVCHCSICDTTFMPTDPLHICPNCNTTGATVCQGHEFVIVAVDVESE